MEHNSQSIELMDALHTIGRATQVVMRPRVDSATRVGDVVGDDRGDGERDAVRGNGPDHAEPKPDNIDSSTFKHAASLARQKARGRPPCDDRPLVVSSR